MSDLAIDRVPTQLLDLIYAPVSAQLLKFNWQLFWSRMGVPVFVFATTHRTISNWSRTGFKTEPNGTFLSNSSVDGQISLKMGPSRRNKILCCSYVRIRQFENDFLKTQILQ